MTSATATKKNRRVGPKEREARSQRETQAAERLSAEHDANPAKAAAAVAAKANGSASSPRKPLAKKAETDLVEKISAIFPEGHAKHEAALRYGRKLVKKQQGLRASNPPATGLTKDDASKIAKSIVGEPKETKEV
jgi:hypothetical protein